MKISGFRCPYCGCEEIFVNENHAYYQCNQCEKALDLSEYTKEPDAVSYKSSYDIYLNDGSNYVSWNIGDEKVCIGGYFTIQELESIISRVCVVK